MTPEPRREGDRPSIGDLLGDYNWRVHEDLKAEGRRAMGRPTGIAKVRSFHLMGLVTLIERIHEAYDWPDGADDGDDREATEPGDEHYQRAPSPPPTGGGVS